jgi:succinoglycan biosynthesis transport protein ExoP
MSEQLFAAKRDPSVDKGDDPRLNVQHYVQLFLKRIWLIIGVLILVVGITAVWIFTRTPIYEATATVLIERRAPQVLGSEVHEVVDTSMNSVWRNKEYMETQVRILTSRALAHDVVKRLNLTKSKAFWAPAGSRAGKPDKQPTVEDTAAALQSKVTVSAVRDADILEVSVKHADPKMAAQLANTLIQAYRDESLDYKVSSTSGAVEWLSDQLDDLKKQLESAELALHTFKKKNNMVSVSLEDKQTLISRRIERIQDALTAVQLQRMETAALRKQLVKAKTQDPLEIVVGPVMQSPTVRSLKESYVTAKQKYRALRERYLENHPLVRQQQATLDAIRKNLAGEINQEVAAIQSKFRELSDHETELAAALQAAKSESLDLNKRELDYQRLKRNAENTSRLYSLVLSRMKESDLSAQLRVSNIRPLDAARPPEAPVSPRVKITLALSLVLGLMLGMGLAFVVDLVDNSVKSQADVEQLTDLVTLGVFPRIPVAANAPRGQAQAPGPELELIVHKSSKSAVAESCRSIRTNLLFASTERELRSMVVTSPGPSEGKTTTAVSLAIAMAQAGSRVLLVDTDMRRPRIHRVFGVPGSKGISSVLLGQETIEDVVKTTEVPNLYLLPCGPIPPNPAEMCQSERFKQTLTDLEERYDRVILDSPPVLVVTDAAVLSTVADGTLVVARSGKTTRPALREAARNLGDVGAKLLGCVLNDMDLEKRNYGYYRYRRYGYSTYTYARSADEEEAAAS